jgi:hypothetical protein
MALNLLFSEKQYEEVWQKTKAFQLITGRLVGSTFLTHSLLHRQVVATTLKEEGE